MPRAAAPRLPATATCSLLAAACALLAIGGAAGGTGGSEQPTGCAESDARLDRLRNVLCVSIEPNKDCPGSGNMTAHGDWPNQVVYYRNVLDAVADPATCLNTSTARGVVRWLDETNSTTSPWWNTWVVFQVQYYDMPRKPGARIESPATLGRKCWAFAYLAQVWAELKPALQRAMARAPGLSLAPMFAAYEEAVSETIGLCDRVMANCFVNQTYNPARNGTCPDVAKQFYVGFQWENLGGTGRMPNGTVAFPFATYDQTGSFHADASFAVGTALNYIV